MAKVPKVHALFSTRTNSSKVTFREIKNGTLEELCNYYGVTAKSITSLVNRVNMKFADRYVNCYNSYQVIRVATPEQIVEFTEQKVD